MKQNNIASQEHHNRSGQAYQAKSIDPTDHGRSKERRVLHSSRIRGERVKTTIRHVHPPIERIHDDEHDDNWTTSSLTVYKQREESQLNLPRNCNRLHANRARTNREGQGIGILSGSHSRPNDKT